MHRQRARCAAIRWLFVSAGGWAAAAETTTTTVDTSATSTTSATGDSTTTTETGATTTTIPTPLFSDDAFAEARAGVDSHPGSDPLDALQGTLQGYVTRGQLAVRLAELLGLGGSNAAYFADVTGHEECFGAVGALWENQLLTGASTLGFLPDQLVSRAQALVWVTDALGYKLTQQDGSKVPFRFSFFDSAEMWLGGFRDRGMVSAVLARGVANAYRLGIVDVPPDACLYPALPLTQTDMSVILGRAFSTPITVRNAPPAAVTAKANYPSLKIKSEGPLVWYLEYQLAALKYRPGPIEGVFDVRTRDAVLAFQKVEKLKRDGIVGDSLWKRLATAKTPEPRMEEAGTRVEVDLTRQVLFLIVENQVTKIVHISSGKSTTGTLVGQFKVAKKIPRWLHDSYQTTMYYSSFFSVGHRLAVHGYSEVPVWPASHGCVRTPNWMAKELYEEMPMGTRVFLYK
jgi:N-acetylmuramoyl-L-alanine amidase